MLRPPTSQQCDLHPSPPPKICASSHGMVVLAKHAATTALQPCAHQPPPAPSQQSARHLSCWSQHAPHGPHDPPMPSHPALSCGTGRPSSWAMVLRNSESSNSASRLMPSSLGRPTVVSTGTNSVSLRALAPASKSSMSRSYPPPPGRRAVTRRKTTAPRSSTVVWYASPRRIVV